ncbi:MAG: hypothetical protein AAFP10_08870 [Pseudomonadota bacterium]
METNYFLNEYVSDRYNHSRREIDAVMLTFIPGGTYYNHPLAVIIPDEEKYPEDTTGLIGIPNITEAELNFLKVMENIVFFSDSREYSRRVIGDTFSAIKLKDLDKTIYKPGYNMGNSLFAVMMMSILRAEEIIDTMPLADNSSSSERSNKIYDTIRYYEVFTRVIWHWLKPIYWEHKPLTYKDYRNDKVLNYYHFHPNVANVRNFTPEIDSFLCRDRESWYVVCIEHDYLYSKEPELRMPRYPSKANHHDVKMSSRRIEKNDFILPMLPYQILSRRYYFTSKLWDSYDRNYWNTLEQSNIQREGELSEYVLNDCMYTGSRLKQSYCYLMSRAYRVSWPTRRYKNTKIVRYKRGSFWRKKEKLLNYYYQLQLKIIEEPNSALHVSYSLSDASQTMSDMIKTFNLPKELDVYSTAASEKFGVKDKYLLPVNLYTYKDRSRQMIGKFAWYNDRATHTCMEKQEDDPPWLCRYPHPHVKDVD